MQPQLDAPAACLALQGSSDEESGRPLALSVALSVALPVAVASYYSLRGGGWWFSWHPCSWLASVPRSDVGARVVGVYW